MLSNNKRLAIAAVMLALTGSGAASAQSQESATSGTSTVGRSGWVGDTPVPLGPSYAVGGVTYTPADSVSYDEVGYAGESESGSQNGATASGEAFAPAAITAAHKTLPLPSYIEVTALDSGRTILVRVNDRGPMRNDRLIALSPGAMAQLGVSGHGSVPVRVRRVNPPEQERAVLRGQGQAAARLDTPAALLKALRGKLGPVQSAAIAPPHASSVPKSRPVAASASSRATTKPGGDFDRVLPPSHAATPPARPMPQPKPVPAKPGADFDPSPPQSRTATSPAKPVPKPKPVAASVRPVATAKPLPPPPVSRAGGYVVQVGAFSSQSRAEALAKSMGARAEAGGGGLWRVRLGPYPTQQAAQAGVRSAAAKGFENVRIMANDAR